MMLITRLQVIIALLTMTLMGCRKGSEPTAVEKYAANEEVAAYMRAFEGRGDLTDADLPPSSPENTLASFKLPEDMEARLVLSEPDIHQPLELQFDHKGRLWVVQYNQYPYPEGLKITSIDNHNRVKFDKQPEAPPLGTRGADKITFFEDSNGDGYYDQATDAITGLNIATSVALGRGKIWVLNPPYLLAYPDADDDGIPDGDPVVCASGFGLEDTHSVANSLHWGPDGWLYGVNGSTTTASISTAKTSNLSFSGQAIWRYHPELEEFELFAEGGGNNPFSIEFDSQGRVFSGSNGYGRGPYYKQGAYYIKGWGKHGPLTDPFAFGYLENMPLEGERKRFTHGLVIYEANGLPDRYQGKIISVNPLHGYLQMSRFENRGSNFSNIDEETLLESTDKWFRPIDIKVGPDAALYISDWYDSRLSHVDPRDTWYKESGRIYRISAKGNKPKSLNEDLSRLSSKDLLAYFSHPNKWFRQQALRLLGDRKDRVILAPLMKILETERGQPALEALWASYQIEGISLEMAKIGLEHVNPMVRMWTIRLLGDEKEVPADIFPLLKNRVKKETHPEVRSQILSTCKRLPPYQTFELLTALMASENSEQEDPDLPLQYWWAVSAQARKDHNAALEFITQNKLNHHPLVSQTLLPRLAQQWTLQGKEEHYRSLQSLLHHFQKEEQLLAISEGILEGSRGKALGELPSYLLEAMETYIGGINMAFVHVEDNHPSAFGRAKELLFDENVPLIQRNAWIEQLGYAQSNEGKELLLELTQKTPSKALQRAAIQALSYYQDPEIGDVLARAYPQLRADSYTREALITLFTTREEWAFSFFDALEKERTIHREDVPPHLALAFKDLEDKDLIQKVENHWPELAPLSDREKTNRIKRYKQKIEEEKGDLLLGKQLYLQTCAACHVLNGEGGSIGPELTGYDRSDLEYLLLHTVDPSADIREGYETVMVKTLSGSFYSGKVQDESGDMLTLSPVLGGKSVNLKTSEIAQKELQSRSTMPERMLERLSDKELRALFAYLME